MTAGEQAEQDLMLDYKDGGKGIKMGTILHEKLGRN